MEYINEMKTSQERDIYPIELIKTGILILNLMRSPKNGYYPYNAARSLLIYTFEDCGDSILPINREYKPLGYSLYSDWIDYENHDFLKIPKDRLDFSVLDNKNYFFSDLTFPYSAKNKIRYIQLVRKFFKNERQFGYYRGQTEW